MLVATVDFMKALDSTCHQFRWKVVEKCGIVSHYMNFLRRLYADQRGQSSQSRKVRYSR